MLIAVAAVLSACGKGKEKETKAIGGPLSVYTVNYPLAYFAERIGGDQVAVTFPAPRDEDPAYWKPDATTIATYQEADVVLLNGANYAKWVSKVSLPSSRLVDTSASLADQFIKLKKKTTHAHGPEGKHAHGGIAFTTWLDPTLAVKQARAVKDALSRKRPDSKAVFASRFAELEQDLMGIDAQLKHIASVDSRRPVIFSHPVYQYFERRYGINGKSVHWEPDQAPSEKMVGELKELLAKHPAKWMIWEGEPDPQIVRKLRELGVECVVFDPCGNKPDKGDLMSVMRSNVTRFRGSLARH
jgi:zinc transport system substrate-binding protein